MNDIGKLMDALCEAYENPKFKADPNGITHCDATANYVLSKFGCILFAADEIMADDIVRTMRNSQKFQKLKDSEAAQASANRGIVVVAGLTGADMGDTHGHVAFVRPGTMEDSTTWKKKAPKVMSNGSVAATTFSERMSKVFRKEPEYFALVSTL